VSRQNTTTGWMLSSTGAALGTDIANWAFHLWIKGQSAPSSAKQTGAWSLQTTGTFSFNSGFIWDDTRVGFPHSVFNKRASGAFDTCQIPGTFVGGTWYAIGARLLGSTLDVFLNGAKVSTLASGAPPNSVANMSLFNNVAGSGTPFLGSIGEAACWYTNLPTDADFAALAKGQTAELILPQNTFAYWPLWGFHSPELDLSTSVRRGTLNGTLSRDDEPPITPQLMPWE
jgi:hypothetical protein